MVGLPEELTLEAYQMFEVSALPPVGMANLTEVVCHFAQFVLVGLVDKPLVVLAWEFLRLVAQGTASVVDGLFEMV